MNQILSNMFYPKYDPNFSIEVELSRLGYKVSFLDDGRCRAVSPSGKITIGFNEASHTPYDVNFQCRMWAHDDGVQVYSGIQPLNKKDFYTLMNSLFPSYDFGAYLFGVISDYLRAQDEAKHD